MSLSGIGTPLPLVLAPNSLSFGSVPLGLASPPQLLSIGNASIVNAVVIQSLSINPPRFQRVAGGTCSEPPITIALGGSCSIAVVFAPLSVAALNGVFALRSTQPAASVVSSSITLQGTGIPSALISSGFEDPP